jgi:hypothetical protein
MALKGYSTSLLQDKKHFSSFSCFDGCMVKTTGLVHWIQELVQPGPASFCHDSD